MLKSNLEQIRAKIRQACERIGRAPNDVTLVCVTKGIHVDNVRETVSLGITDIGENRVQEALAKYNELQAKIRWHMVGHLQTNKAKHAVRIFDLIHSVDSLKLAEAIDEEARKINKIQEVLIEVNISRQPTKFGIEPEKTPYLIEEILKFKNLNLRGLMTIAPLVDNPEEVRSYFKMLRELRDKFNHLTNYQLTILSMGMSQDYEVAIEEGSTMVRIGTAIFRNP